MGVPIGFRHQDFDILADYLFLRIAEHFFRSRAEGTDQAIFVNHHHRIGNRGQDGFQYRIRLIQFAFGGSERRDILEGYQDCINLPFRIGQGCQLAFRQHRTAIRQLQLHLNRHDFVAGLALKGPRHCALEQRAMEMRDVCAGCSVRQLGNAGNTQDIQAGNAAADGRQIAVHNHDMIRQPGQDGCKIGKPIRVESLDSMHL